MRKLGILAAAAAISLSMLAGCAFNTQVAADVQTQVTKACGVVQPTLLDLAAAVASDPVKQAIVKKVADDNAKLCTANAALDTTSAQDLVNTSIPALQQLVGLLPIDGPTRNAVQLALLVFQVAVSNALTQFGVPTPVPAAPVAPAPTTTPTVAPIAPVTPAVATQ